MEGGGGYSPREIALWSPDQVCFRLCNIKILKRGREVPTEKVSSDAVVSSLDDDGMIKARDKDGNSIKLSPNVGGKSLAGTIIEKERQKQIRTERWERRKRKRQKRQKSNGN